MEAESLQQPARMVKGHRLQEGLGAEARPAREQALQVCGAEPCLVRQGLQARVARASSRK